MFWSICGENKAFLPFRASNVTRVAAQREEGGGGGGGAQPELPPLKHTFIASAKAPGAADVM